MDSFELNKIFASILIALILNMFATLVSEELIRPSFLKTSVFHIPLTEPNQAPIDEKSEIIEPIDAYLAKASVENGEKIAKRCLQCHSFEKDGIDKIGPNLWGIVGAKYGHKEGYAYSSAVKEKTGNWGTEALNRFLSNPKKEIPGTKMSFAGLPKVTERADVVAYLQTLGTKH